jgi:CheY-like chemotaxis protein
VDLRSGNLDGWIALDRLKHTLATAHLPVVALAAQADRSKALHMGAVEVIQRLLPGEVERVLRRVSALQPDQSRRLLLISEDSRTSAG